MGSMIEINDTLQITSEQGFPKELDLERHLKAPFTAEDFKDKIFEFYNKPNIRIYQVPPIRNFFAENRNGKWIYWGLIHIVELKYDYEKKMTSGKFRIVYINTPDEMKKAHELTDRYKETNFFE